MRKTVLTFGIISGLLAASLFLISFTLGTDEKDFSNGVIIGYISMIIALSAIFFAIRSFRNKQQDGYIKFWKGFLIGLYISIIASSFYAIGWMIYDSNSNRDFMTEYREYMIKEMDEKELTQAEKDKRLERFDKNAENYKNPFFKFGWTFMEIFPIGIIITIISSLILMKRNKEMV